MSYIVKNCPAITEYKFPDKVHKDCCQCTYGYCKNIDCVIKQVIEIAKDIIEKDCYENSDVKAEKILQLFDIEEVNK